MTPRRPTADEQLDDGARRALRKHGWAGATLERIAAEAGVSRVTLHRRGLTKEAILGRLAEAATQAYRDAMWPVLTAGGTGRERLEAALRALCEEAEQNMDLLLALSARASGTVFHEDGEEELLTRGVFTEPLERLLRDGAADGSLRVADPVEGATVLFNLVGWTYIHLRAEHRWTPERARRATLGIALDGVSAG